jgi:hypothetical protein
MLTVFKTNYGACRLYRDALGYAVDGDDPSRHGDGDA